MQVVNLIGKLASDGEVRTDKKGHNYYRFVLNCSDKDSSGASRTTPFRCYTYNSQMSDLKQGEVVFLSGDLMVNTTAGKTNLDVYVRQITRSMNNQ